MTRPAPDLFSSLPPEPVAGMTVGEAAAQAGAVAARDRALAQVADNAGAWIDLALDAIRRHRGSVLPGGFTGEDLRMFLRFRIPGPHHHNAWGALIREAIKAGLIRKTTERRLMRGPKSHARETAVYQWA